METRASYVLVGAFTLSLVAAIFAVFIWLSRADFESTPQRYAIYFTGSVTGLSIGSPARYRGVPIGTVTAIAIDPEDIERIRVEIEVAEGTPIKTDMVASLGVQGVTGVAFIQLTGGTKEAPVLVAAPGQGMPVIPSEQSGLERLFSRAPELLDNGVALLERIARVFDERNLAAVTETLQNIRAVTETVAGQREKVAAVLDDTQATLAALRATSESFRGLSKTLESKAGPLTESSLKTIADIRRTLGEIQAATRSMRSVADGLNNLVDDSRTPIRDFSTSGLYEFSQFLAEARLLVAGLTRLSAQIERDPARFFFGDTQKGFEPK